MQQNFAAALSAAFVDAIRGSLFGGRLPDPGPQVDGINALFAAWQQHGDGDAHKLAYVLATAFHETAETMQPIAEYGRGQGHPYGVADATGKAPYGRGFIQLTWAANYQKADSELGLGGRLAANYDLALEPDIAAPIAIRGMMEGWFTGKRLADYIGAGRLDFVDARRIINGTDRAETIALYAKLFDSALAVGGSAQPVPAAPAPASTTPAAATILRLGMHGDAVRSMQAELSKAGIALAADGAFGPITERAVKAFQAAHGLVQDGIAGPKTFAALKAAS